MYSKTTEQQMKEQQELLRDMYLGLSDTLILMSKMSDNDRLAVMHTNIDNTLKRTVAVRQQIETLQKELTDRWQTAEQRSAA
jgi:hypothetical protein